MTAPLDPHATAAFPAPAHRSRPSTMPTHALPHAVTEPITVSPRSTRIGGTALVASGALVVGLGLLGSLTFRPADAAPAAPLPAVAIPASADCGEDTAGGGVTLHGAGLRLPVHVEISAPRPCGNAPAPHAVVVSVGRDS